MLYVAVTVQTLWPLTIDTIVVGQFSAEFNVLTVMVPVVWPGASWASAVFTLISSVLSGVVLFATLADRVALVVMLKGTPLGWLVTVSGICGEVVPST